MHFMVTSLDQTTIYEQCVLRCGCKNTHKKDTRLKEIELCAQNKVTIQDSIVNILKGVGGCLYDHLVTSRILL